MTLSTFSDLKDKTLIEVTKFSDSVTFVLSDHSRYELRHNQDCCEQVYLEDVIGELDDLIGSPIVMAEEVTDSYSHPDGFIPKYTQKSFTWTFYKLATLKGYVTFRFYGTSNGYYGERVDFCPV